VSEEQIAVLDLCSPPYIGRAQPDR
jgi:hypothetical protein